LRVYSAVNFIHKGADKRESIAREARQALRENGLKDAAEILMEQ
jgi:hypothetical protein